MQVDESLQHTKWECKYHVVFIPKYQDASFQFHKSHFARRNLSNL